MERRGLVANLLNFIKMKLVVYLKNGDEPSPLHFYRVLKGSLKIGSIIGFSICLMNICYLCATLVACLCILLNHKSGKGCLYPLKFAIKSVIIKIHFVIPF